MEKDEALESARVRALMREGESLDDLRRDGMRILQRRPGFCFGMDSVLLASFAAGLQRASGPGRGVDLGAGSGVLSFLLCGRMPGLVMDAVELDPEAADRALRSVEINRMEERIRVHNMDLRDAPERLGFERHRLAVCNPPYVPAGGGPVNPDPSRGVARHEGEAGIGDICRVAFALLQNGGRLAVIFPAPRFLLLADAMREARMEPKRALLIHPAVGKPPNLVLVEGAKAARPALHFLPPLFVRDADGRETEALQSMYR